MPYKHLALALVMFLAAPLTATALPVTYQIKFTALTGSVVTATFPNVGPTTSVQANAVGNVYYGLFAVDDAILLMDGLNQSGIVDFFRIQMEDNIWGYNLADNNSFLSFRGPNCTSSGCSGPPSPGFDVASGAITNLRGGVFGVGDIPYVDFSGIEGPNTFAALGRPIMVPGTSFSYVKDLTGTMEVFRVPEPGTLPLFGFGLLALLVGRRVSRR